MLDAWVGTQIQTRLNNEKVGNITIGGSSAGMHVLSDVIYRPDWQSDGVASVDAIQNPAGPDMTFQTDAGGPSFLDVPMFSGMVFDTHFWQRDRMGRTAAFLAVTSAIRAISADEETALLVDAAGVATVVAANDGNQRNVYFLDSTPAFDSTSKTVVVSSIEVWKLQAGDSFDLNLWLPVCLYSDHYYLDVDGTIPYVRGRDIVTGALESRYGGTTPLPPP